MSDAHAAYERRRRRMRQSGLRFVGGKGAELLSEACKFALRVYAETGEEYGIVLDRGENKKHGLQTRYSGPFTWSGEPVYWLRKVTWCRKNDER